MANIDFTPTKEQMRAWTRRIFEQGMSQHFRLPTKCAGERNPFPGVIHFPLEPYDDGGGAAIAGYKFGLCPFCGPADMISGYDLSNGVETHVEAYYEKGVMHVTDVYEITRKK